MVRLASFAGVFLLAGCASSEADDTNAASADVIGGKASTAAADESFVAVTSPNNPEWICSGTVIAPRVVLTAGHCVIGGNSDKTGWSFEIFIGADRNKRKKADTVIKVASFHVPDVWRAGQPTGEKKTDAPADPSGGDEEASTLPEPSAEEIPTEETGPSEAFDDADSDIGVLILAEPTTVKPIAWNKTPLTKSVVGKKVRFVGYGLDKPRPDKTGKNGVRKAHPTKIAGVTPGAVAIPPGDNPCNGDSGGPLLLEMDGVTTLIGVGHVAFDADTCRGGADYQRTDRYADFVQKYLDQAAEER